MEQLIPSSLLQMLLIIAGIETNPGPKRVWDCTVCKNKIDERKEWSVKCNSCKLWLHWDCSELGSHGRWSRSFIGQCCRSPPVPKTVATISATSVTTTLKILQLNANGLRNKIDNIIDYLEQNKIGIAAIQESHLNEKSSLKVAQPYTILRSDRPSSRGKGGGVCFIVHNTVSHAQLQLDFKGDPHIEAVGIEIQTQRNNENVKIVNLYIPPSSSCNPGYQANINHLLELENAVILGDFNAHHCLWNSSAEPDKRGEELAAVIESSNFAALNEEEPTRVTKNCMSSPDVTLVSDNLLMNAQWNIESALGSDHRPITVSIGCEVTKLDNGGRKFINFRKADWDLFRESTEEIFKNATKPTNAHIGEKFFRKTLIKAANISIPGA